MKKYTCENCNVTISEKELNATWDWSGPHCPNCGHTGMSMLGNILDQDGGVQNSLFGYEEAKSKLDKTIAELRRAVRRFSIW